MAQHIGLAIQDEQGIVLERSELNFAELLNLIETFKQFDTLYPTTASIDPYADTLLDSHKVEFLIAELEQASNRQSEKKFTDSVAAICRFLGKVRGHADHYVKFIGD